MQFQTRNVRRKLQTLAKRTTSTANTTATAGSQPNAAMGNVDMKTSTVMESEDYGSTWMCCLALLAGVSSPQSSVHYAEALFAAQTLLHRLRRVKMVEAMDLEMEPPLMESPLDPHQLHHRYIQWMQQWKHSNPNSMLHLMTTHLDHTTDDEERLKCEWTLGTLAALIMEIALATHMRPLVATLASALAVTAARMRFTPASVPHPATNTEPIITMIWITFERLRARIGTSSEIDEVYQWVLFTCITALPDALLAGSASGGGAHGSISMDPRCYTAVTMELRTHGMMQVCESLLQHSQPNQQLLFALCQQWAKYAPMPMELLQATVPSIHSIFQEKADPQILSAAIGFWITVMEAGCWTVEEVLASALLQKQDQQPNKKRQSNKSKKRQQEVLQERTTENHFFVAQQEVLHRQELAFLVAQETFGAVRQLAIQELGLIQDSQDEVAGEGPVGAVVACANACLPYIVRSSNPNLALFVDISVSIQSLCRSPSRMVRGFATETIYSLHEAALEELGQRSINGELASALVNHFFQCSMSLSLQCSYPPGYFLDLTANNDDELENERTEMRDLLRSCAGTSSPEINSSSPSFEFVSAILLRLIQACAEPFLLTVETTTETRHLLFSETVMHAFSALSRPLITTAKAYAEQPVASNDALKLSLIILRSAGQRLIAAFPHVSLSDSLPLSRLYNLALASLSPALSSLLSSPLQDETKEVIGVGIDAAMASLVYVPELVAPSSLRSSRFDIRGAMRTPGGEDHSGVLALMRLATHNDRLSNALVQTKSNVSVDFCDLYIHLKLVEQERGRGIFHGKGILPKSRRILLSVICYLESATNGAAGASPKLRDIFEHSVNTIVALGAESFPSVDALFQVAEHTFDIAGFSPEIIRTLFESMNASTTGSMSCVDILTRMGCLGYLHMFDSSLSSEAISEWNRLRAALFCLFKSSRTVDLPSSAIPSVVIFVQTECESILKQCSLGPLSSSKIFCEDLVSDEVVPAGLFLHVIHDVLEKGGSRPLKDMIHCIDAMCQCQKVVLEAISSTCPNPVEKGSFYDPRPMVAEAWFLTILRLMKVLISRSDVDPFEVSIKENGAELTDAVQRLITDTCSTCIRLLLYPSLGKTQAARANDPGPSTDGPHMLIAMEFIETYFMLGSSILGRVALDLSQAIPIDATSIHPYSDDRQAIGVAIIGAAIFRAAQGGLPPWAVECMPSIFCAFYNSALNQNSGNFATAICMSMQVRWNHDHGGELLSGRFFQSMGEKAKSTFVEQAVEISQTNTPVAWKRMKSLIKQACGGKKKETDYRQRPGLTKLEALDRV